MRIIGGKYRGRKLVSVGGESVRPTSDRTKESLFNILRDRIEGAIALDLFCGSGAVGIECLSRGAAKVTFNDVSKDSLAVTKRNLTGIEGEYILSNRDGSLFFKAGERYDFIYIDPPYRSGYGVSALKQIAALRSLSDGGVAVFECDEPFEGEILGLKIIDRRKYGRAHLTFFALEKE